MSKTSLKEYKENRERTERMEKEAILEYIELGRGNTERKAMLAKELGLSVSALKYKVKKFIAGKGVGRQQRSDKGVPKKDPEISVKRKFFAELAQGVSADEAGLKLGLTEHQTNMLSKEFKKVDKWRAIREAPQLDILKDLIADVFKIDLATVEAGMAGAFTVEAGSVKISIPLEELNDIKTILAHCMQRDDMAKIDPEYRLKSKDQLERVRVYYLKEDLLEKRNVTEYTRLHRAVKTGSPEKQMDLKLVYAVIDRFQSGLDEQDKIRIIKEEYEKMKI